MCGCVCLSMWVHMCMHAEQMKASKDVPFSPPAAYAVSFISSSPAVRIPLFICPPNSAPASYAINFNACRLW